MEKWTEETAIQMHKSRWTFLKMAYKTRNLPRSDSTLELVVNTIAEKAKQRAATRRYVARTIKDIYHALCECELSNP